MQITIIKGKMIDRPEKGSLTPAVSAPFPLSSISDFEVGFSIKIKDDEKVYLDFRTYYELLQNLLPFMLYNNSEGRHILIQARMPASGRLFPELLSDEVFLVQDIVKEQERYNLKNLPYVTVRDGLKRYPQERGCNDIVISFYGGGFIKKNEIENVLRSYCIELEE